MSGCRAFATPLGLQDFRKFLTDGNTLSGQAALQQIQRGIKLIALVGFLFNCRTCCPDETIDIVHESLETWQSSGIGDPSAAKENYSPFFMRLQEKIGNIRAIGNKLHG